MFIVTVFSVGDPDSYENVREMWIPEVKRQMPNTPIVLVGNKIDMRTDLDCLKELAKCNEKPIKTEMGKNLAREINAASYIESSFVDGTVVERVFEEAV